MASAQQGYYDDDGIWHDPDDAQGEYGAPPADAPPTAPPPAEDPAAVPPPTTTDTGTTAPPTLPPWMTLPDMPDLGDAPRPDLPVYQKPPAFSFHAPTAQEALDNPGYKFRVTQGLDALQRWAAAKGTLNDTGTANALTDYGQNAATQEYNNLFNREWQTQTGAYDRNYQGQYLDPYRFDYQRALDTWKPQFDTWQTRANLTSGDFLNRTNDVYNLYAKYLDDYLAA